MARFNRGFAVEGDLALTSDGRDVDLVSGPAKIAQSIRTRAQIFKGSWRYDRKLGVPYFQDILVTGASKELVRRRFQELLSGTDGVLSVTSLAIRFEGSTVYVDFVVVADTGEVVRDTLDFVAAN
jgi:hypothetical protein